MRYLCGMIADNLDAALFDLDGVVFDTEPLYTKFWGGTFSHYMPGSHGLEQAIKGSTLVQILDGYFPDPATQRAITAELDDYERHMSYDYVEGFVEFVSRLRCKKAVVTSSNRPKMENVYRCHPEFRGFFDAILTSEDFSQSKPSPDCYLRAAARLGVEPARCACFEDSFNGLRSGRAAGMYVVGLATTNRPEDIAPYCDEIINNFKEI